MDKYVKRFVFFSIITVLVMGAFLFAFFPPGDILSQFSFQEGLRTMDGIPVTRLEDVTLDNAIIAIYWRMECSYCRRQFEELRYIGATILASNIGNSEYDVRRYLEDNDIDFVISLIGLKTPPPQGMPYMQLLVKVGERWMLLNEWAGLVRYRALKEALSKLPE